MKNTEITADGINVGTKRPLTGAATTQCHNLRPSTTPNGQLTLRPVGSPLTVAEGRWTLLTTMAPSDSVRLLIVADGPTLACVNVSPVAEPVSDAQLCPRTVAELSADIRCATSSGSRLTVMTDDGMSTLVYDLSDGSWTQVDVADFPVLSLVAEPVADASATVAPRRLSCEYTAGMNYLADLDRRHITRDMQRAYYDICSQAAADRTYCAPMLCRYRLVGHDGETLHTSAPLLLGAADSGRLTAPVTVTSSDRRNLDSYTLSAPRWRLRVCSAEAVPSALTSYVSRIEILATHPFHPFDPSEEARLDVVSAVNTTDFIRATLPGASRAVASSNPAVASARMRQAVAVMPKFERVVAVISAPFGDGKIDIVPEVIASCHDVDYECAEIERAMGATPDTVDQSLSAISLPHRFSARAVASVAGHNLWGDLCALRFKGYPAEAFAAERAGEGSWHAAVAVGFSTGDECVVAISQGLSGAPLKFNPMLSYPSSDATSITITVSAGGKVRRGQFRLTPDPALGCALYVDSSMQPFGLPDEADAFVAPVENLRRREMHSYLAVVSEKQPYAPLSAVSLGDSALLAVRPACRSQSGWDVNRLRFIAFTSSGIYAVNAPRHPGSTPATVNLIDNAVICSPYAVTDAGGRMVAVASRRLVEVGLTKVTTLIDDISATTLAYEPSRRELWASAGGTSKVIMLDRMRMTSRDEALAGPAVATYACVGDRIVDLSKETPDGSRFIRFDAETAHGLIARRYHHIGVDLSAEKCDGLSLSLWRRNSDKTETRYSFDMVHDGAVRSPYRRRIPMLPYHGARVDLQGRVSSDMVLNGIVLYDKKSKDNGSTAKTR